MQRSREFHSAHDCLSKSTTGSFHHFGKQLVDDCMPASKHGWSVVHIRKGVDMPQQTLEIDHRRNEACCALCDMIKPSKSIAE